MAIGLFWATVCLCMFLSVLALDIMGFFSRKNHFEVDGRVLTLALLGDTRPKLTLQTDNRHHRRLPGHGKRFRPIARIERCEYRARGSERAEARRSREIHICALLYVVDSEHDLTSVAVRSQRRSVATLS